jgi:multidrug efflux pump subunit AcrB
MSENILENNTKREFKITTLALKNRNTVFLLAFAILLFGWISFNSLPKELYPEVAFPTVMVQTIYPGNAPIDIENLITRPLEKEVETINGIKKLSSNSLQDISFITVEFNYDVDLDKALRDVKDAVDRAQRELPSDLIDDPTVADIDLSEFPIININLSGDYSREELRTYAEYLQDRIEEISEISRVDIKGVNERQVKINVDLLKMQALNLTFFDIETAIISENMSLSGGELIQGRYQRSIRVFGEFSNMKDIENVIVKREEGEIIYLKDLADVQLGFEDPTNFARLNEESVVSLQVIKKSGENLLNATDQIFALMEEPETRAMLPENLKINYTNDQSDMIRMQLSNLVNSMIMGMIFVVFVLFYFLGSRNALIVGIAIPLSMFTSFIVLGLLGYTINMIILFSLILALGMLVDNAIVVVENIYRFISQGHKPLVAAQQAVGEIAVPIIVSTITTLAAFFPLAFWESISGEFMKALPITLIIVLTSSLFVALVITPVLSSRFIKKEEGIDRRKSRKRSTVIASVLVLLGIIGYVTKQYFFANLVTILGIIMFLDLFLFYRIGVWFQYTFLPWLENMYLKVLRFSLRGRNPWLAFIGTVFLLIGTMVFFVARNPEIGYFPEPDPSYINVIAEHPIGTSIYATDSFAVELEKDLEDFLIPHDDILKSVLTTIGKGSPDEFSIGDEAHKSITTVEFIDYQYRGDKSTTEILTALSEEFIGRYPGVILSVEKQTHGPAAGKAINIEVSGENIQELIVVTDSMKTFIENADIAGIEGLKTDLDVGKPELVVQIDREKARRFGLSTSQIAMNLRTSLYGKEISDYKVGEDEYPIVMRLQDEYRYNVASLMNQVISFQEEGQTINIPLSSVAEVQYSSTYGTVNRKDRKRVITIFSNVIEGFNPTRVNQQIRSRLNTFNMPEGYSYEFTGEQQEQQESMEFLSRAMLIAVTLIFIILVTQFNSVIKPAIIAMTVLFSTIGVFGGLATFKIDFIVVMMGIGIVSLAGIVVNNGIVLLDYIELLKARKRKELGLDANAFLPTDVATECIIQGGKTRLRPVLLTAITTVMGLISLAIGLNIDFNSMLSEFDPQIYFGGDMVAFWGPISWTVIFGLTFATFLTLVIVPVMYRITVLLQKRINKLTSKIT